MDSPDDGDKKKKAEPSGGEAAVKPPSAAAKAPAAAGEESEPSSSDEDDGDKKMVAAPSADSAVAAAHENKWNEMFSRLEAYKKEHGHCLVPNRFTEDPQLGGWVSTQRRHYRVMQEGVEPSPMTEERAQRLEALNFQWTTKDPRHVPWKQRYDELVSFKETYGHSQVPIGWEENVQLSNWVSTQRQEFKLLQKGRSSRLTNERIALLNKVDFVWEAQRGGPRRKRKATVSVPPRPCPVEGVGPLPSSSSDAKKKPKTGNTPTSHAAPSQLTGTASTVLRTNPPAPVNSILYDQLMHQSSSSATSSLGLSAPSLLPNVHPQWDQQAPGRNIVPIPAPFSSLLTNQPLSHLQGSLQPQPNNPLVASSLESVISPSLYLQLALGQQPNTAQQAIPSQAGAPSQQSIAQTPSQTLNQTELTAALSQLQQPSIQPPQQILANQADLAAALGQIQQPNTQPPQVLNTTQLAAALGLQPPAAAPAAQLSAQNLPQASPASILQSLLAAQQTVQRTQEETKQSSSANDKNEPDQRS